MNQGDKRKARDLQESSSDEEIIQQPIQIDQKQEMEEEVNLDFVFLDPNQKQFQSIKNLLNSYLEGISFKSSELANNVCDQVELGTMVGQEDEDNVFGFVTILNINQNKVIGEILNYLENKSQQHNKQHQKMHELLNKRVGLLLNERILNLAPQLVPVLHNQLREDIVWLQSQEPNNPLINLEYLLVVTKCYKDTNQKQQQKKTTSEFSDLVFQKFEDYIFLQKAIVSFRFLSEGNKSTQQMSDFMKTETPEQTCYKLVYIISLKDYLSQIPIIEQYI